jgi:gliding motility-associated lipoprotein GldH
MFVLASIFSACGEKTFFTNSIDFDQQKWFHENAIDFEFEITDLKSKYDLLLDIDLSKDYAYQNIYVNIFTHYPSGKVVEDLVSLDVMDKFGKWNGDCNSNDCTIQLQLQQNTLFPEPGKYKIQMEQHMREDPISELSRMTFKIIQVVE